MNDSDSERHLEQLKAMKSAFLLEGQALMDRGMSAYAAPLFRRAADLELKLIEVFKRLGNEEGVDRQEDVRISMFSAASCLVEAGQFESAVPLLRKLADQNPEAREMLTFSEGKEDQPMVSESPAFWALVQLLTKKGLISQDEWAAALKAV